MKTLISLLIATIFSSSLFAADALNEYLKPKFISNPYNDEEILLTGYYELAREYYLNVMSFNTDTVKEMKIDHNVSFATINGENSRIAYFNDENKVYIYDYQNLNLINSFETEEAFSSSSTADFSKDGSEIYIFHKNNLKFLSYNTLSGEKTKEFILDINPNLYSKALLNSSKKEFALLRGDTLEFWSIDDKQLKREIEFHGSAEKIVFRDNGTKVTYIAGSEVFIRNTEDGNVQFNKEVEISNYYPNYLEFSANLKYMKFGQKEYNDNRIVVDIEEDTIVDPNSDKENNRGIGYYYITSDFKKALIINDIGFWCGEYFGMPRTEYVYYTHDIEENRKLASSPNGFIPSPRNAVMNNESNLIAVSGSNPEDNSNFLIGLFTSEGDFIKYIYVDNIPEAFSQDSKYLVFKNSDTLKFYNIKTEEFEKEFATGIENHNKVYFLSDGGEKIVITSAETIKIFNYEDFTLENTINLNTLSMEPEKIVCSLDGVISIYDNKKLIQFNVQTGTSSEEVLYNIPNIYNFEDMTINGNYLLFGIDKANFAIYDVKNKTMIDNYYLEDIGEYRELNSRGFFGNHQIVWFSYLPDVIEGDPYLRIYDIVADSTKGILGDYEPIISNDGRLYFSNRCPITFTIDSIRDLLVGVENKRLITQNLIYPNPASDYIELELDKVHNTNNLKIYDTFGKVVKNVNVQTISNKIKIDINELPPSVYFIEIGGSVQKFVKM